jgi:integrase
MTPKNIKLIRQVLNNKVWERVVNYPTELMKLARTLKDQAPIKAAVIAEIAVAIAMLTVAPVRAANLTAIRLDENLIRPGGPGTPYLLVYPHYDVKNRVDLTFELDDYLTDLIDEYVHEYRPSLLRGFDGDWLFPGTTGSSKNPHCSAFRLRRGSKRQLGCGSPCISSGMPPRPSTSSTTPATMKQSGDSWGIAASRPR